MSERAVRWIIHGRVQGVGFRYFTWQSASRLGLGGSVRNRPDGTVEVEALGEAAAIGRLRRRLERGPPAARVETIDEEPLGGRDAVAVEFRILR